MWTLFRTFDSEAEARVVEAFLRANQVDVQLLGTHSTTSIVAPGSKRGALRMMVHEDQLAHAQAILAEQESRAHLAIVTDGPPPKIDMGVDRIIITLFVIIFGLIAWQRCL